MDAPDEARLIAALEATWPPVAVDDAAAPGWRLREGAGGGRRVSAASSLGSADFEACAQAMRARGAAPSIRVRESEGALDAALAAAGWRAADPTLFLVGEAAPLAALSVPKGVKFALGRCRLALLDGIWEAEGVGASRRAVMARAPDPKATVMARTDTATAGVAFTAVHHDVGMLHAVAVRPELRRQGAGMVTVVGAARFALDNGARWLALAVTEANAGARAMYEKAGMTAAGGYRYREAP